MRYLVLATDYDGTLATHGTVEANTLEALSKLKQSGRRVIMVTGRELEDLKTVFPEIGVFDLIVAENGGLLYNPTTQETVALSEPPNENFLSELTRRGVPFSVGHGIVATWEPHQTTVLDVVKELGLELQLSFNKGAVMVLPSGINKKSGLEAALTRLSLSSHNVVGIGDAENDHVFLSSCECGVAVANALPALKDRADFVTAASHGAGVVELIARLLDDDLRSFDRQLKRHQIRLGVRAGSHSEAAEAAFEKANGQPTETPADPEEQPVTIAPYRGNLLFAGPSGSGKSTAATGVVERLAEQGYQFCLIDPEGDYENFMGALQLGSPQVAPEVSQILKALSDPHQNLVINLLGIPLEDRPLFFAALLPHLFELRTRTARPHWLIVDEAHHMLPTSWVPAATTLPDAMAGIIMVTVHPEMVAPASLKNVEVAIAVGKDAGQTLAGLAKAVSEPAPKVPAGDLPSGQVIVWCRADHQDPFIVQVEPGKTERRRHLRKYAEGDLGPDRSFYFRGPEDRLNLRAQNLQMFATLAEGLDDETWLFHLRQGDYSQWFRRFIKDGGLAEQAEAIERDPSMSAQDSRSRILAAIVERYTAPV